MILLTFGFSVETGHFYLFGFCLAHIPNDHREYTGSESSHRHHHPPDKPTNIQDSLTTLNKRTTRIHHDWRVIVARNMQTQRK